MVKFKPSQNPTKTDSRDLQRRDSDVRYFLGMPYRWQPQNIFKEFWNSGDDRLFPPKYFGWGWSINLHAIAKKLCLLKDSE